MWETAGPSGESKLVVGLRETPLSGEEGGGSLSIVRLFKQDDHYLGATVKAEGADSGRIVIGRIIKGGVAEKSRLLKEGDELLEVNGTDLRGKSVNEVCDLLRTMSGELAFVIQPCSAEETEGKRGSPDVPEIRHMRALFDYEPEDDYYIPCRELALKFGKRDVLHIISMSDEQWWQGFRDGDDPSQNSLAGLVPSAAFQLQRELYKREVLGQKAKGAGGGEDEGQAQSVEGGSGGGRRRVAQPHLRQEARQEEAPRHPSRRRQRTRAEQRQGDLSLHPRHNQRRSRYRRSGRGHHRHPHLRGGPALSCPRWPQAPRRPRRTAQRRLSGTPPAAHPG